MLAHAPYTLNPASSKPQTREFAVQTLADDLARMEQIAPGQLYNMHPGAHVGQGPQVGVELIAEALNSVLAPEQSTTLLLETMAGKGSEVRRTFEELAAIIEHVELSEHVGVRLDTCHAWDAGYDIAGDLDGVLEKFDRTIGLNRLRAVHVNDSKNPCGERLHQIHQHRDLSPAPPPALRPRGHRAPISQTIVQNSEFWVFSLKIDARLFRIPSSVRFFSARLIREKTSTSMT